MFDEPLSPINGDENSLAPFPLTYSETQNFSLEHDFIIDDGDGMIDNVYDAPEDMEQHEPEEKVTEAVVAQPYIDPLQRIKTARVTLTDGIAQDRDTVWKDDKKWRDGKGYKDYRKKVEDLLEDERRYLGPRHPGEFPINFLQHVLAYATGFVPHDERLYKAKFLLQLIADVDEQQLYPRWGPKPLHTAAKFDIKLLEDNENSESDLTIYTCNLMKDKPGKEIAQTNGDNENVLHFAIRYELKGVEELIELADKSALKQKRTSEDQNKNSQFDDKNTPLHDALDFKKFMVPVPLCQAQRATQQPTVRTSMVTGQEVWRSSITTRPGIDPQQVIQIANQARARANAESSIQSGQARTISTGMCHTCQKAHREAVAAKKKRKNIINLLLKRHMEVLMEHNSAGFSPYLYLLATHKRYTDNENKVSKNSSMTPSPGPSQTTTISNSQARSQQQAYNQQNAKDSTEKKDVQGLYELERKYRRDKESGGGAGTKKSLFNESQAREEETDTAKPGNQSHPAAGVVKQPVKNRQTTHTPGDLRIVNIGSNEVAQELKELAFKFGGYKKAYKCLFRDQSGKNLAPSEEVGRQRSFYLEGNQRVSSTTTKNFNFLIFEPMLASVILSLEYTQEQLEAMPSEKERAERWQKDEENLKKVFRWLKGEKKVKTIVSLTVKDNPNRCCSDETVEECLKDLEVRYLNWNRPDLCAETLRVPNSPPNNPLPTSMLPNSMLQNNLIEISLYWTGLNAVLWSWSDAQGLRTLNKLQKIYLYIQRGDESPQKQDDKVTAFRKRVDEWKGAYKPEIVPCDDNRKLKRDGKGNALDLSIDTPVHSWLQTASKFADDLWTAFREDVELRKDHHHVKVALLDDGVDPTYEHIGQNLHHVGWPSLDTEELEGGKGFYVSANQHGSKMARLIKKVCPFVTIYIAKLDVEIAKDLRHRSFNLQQATKAIEWAVGQGVDIISMSWNARLLPGNAAIGGLERVINAAENKNILMYCAACDVKESSSSDKWYPCDFPKVRSIGATDMDYDVKKNVDMTKSVSYLFPGENILGGPGDAEVGNDGATALAAGLAAVVLFCMKMEREMLPDNRQTWMDNVMKDVFKSDANERVVHVKDVLQLNKAEKAPLRNLVNKFVAQKVR